MRQISYEPHPVTPERKAELIGQGFKIVDLAFKPADDAPAQKPKRASKQQPEAEQTET